MEIKQGQKIIAKKSSGKSKIEIIRHPDPIMDNILIINWFKAKQSFSWIIEKDLDVWINSLKLEGYTDFKTIEDVQPSKKTNKKK